MRRTSIALFLAALGAAALAAPAAAKWTIELGSTPAGLRAGDPWRLEIAVVGDYVPPRPGPPVVRITNVETGSTRAQQAQPLAGTKRTFVATVRFPEEGRWRYTVRYASATFAFGPVVIDAPEPAPASQAAGSKSTPAAGSDDGGFPLWPVLGGTLGAILVVGAGLAWIRARRLPPWSATSLSARIASRGR